MMSGTSADGIDAVPVEFPPGKRPRPGKRVTAPYPAPLRTELLKLAEARSFPVDRIAELSVELGRLHLELALKVSKSLKRNPDFIALHGQTIRHRPEAGYTWQLVDPAPVAAGTGATVISDFRTADVAEGGEGAPLVPFAHQILFADAKKWTAAVNIGGIANVTLLPPAGSNHSITGFDTGPGNMLIDAWVQEHAGQPFDRDGRIARKGTPQPAGRRWLEREPYFAEPPPKSTGREQFGKVFLGKIRRNLVRMGLHDAVATLTLFTSASIADQVLRWSPVQPERVVVCGGGAFNPAILWGLRQMLPGSEVIPSTRMGIEPLAVEAAAFALLGMETLKGLPSNITSVTGATRPAILGRISPGRLFFKTVSAVHALPAIGYTG